MLQGRGPLPARGRAGGRVARTAVHEGSAVIAVVDTGGANLASVLNALARLGAAGEVTSDPARVRAAERVLLPGVGAAPEAAARLRGELGEAVRGLKVPVLGVCLGMQLFFDESEEGPARGLGLLPGV
ncbi:MAG: hypothetical protein KGL74_15040, partial [Elusimicrobia bacterium]|nr:hypothetical protein [Elusimicrobiota bacterium]